MDFIQRISQNIYQFVSIFLDFQSTYFYKTHPVATSYGKLEIFIQDNFANIILSKNVVSSLITFYMFLQ